jgi:hypothetical protein|tara:strand:+ start:340 stop:513 length:174 start_codon:yes stop_codon:yes gene_type:complete
MYNLKKTNTKKPSAPYKMKSMSEHCKKITPQNAAACISYKSSLKKSKLKVKKKKTKK